MTGAWFGGVAIAAALAGGCGFSSDLGGAHFRCQDDGECPDGVSCVGGLCGGSTARDGAASDGPSAAVCPDGALVVESFDGSELDAARWSDWRQGAATVGVAGGRLDITANAIDSGGGVYSVDAVPVDESSLVVEVMTPEDYSSSSMGVELIEMGSTTALVTLCRDNFDLVSSAGGDQGSIPFSPDKHRFWRISEVGDQIRFATSGDGSTWTELFAARSLGLPAETRLSLWAQNYDTAPPLLLSFGSATWCKMGP